MLPYSITAELYSTAVAKYRVLLGKVAVVTLTACNVIVLLRGASGTLTPTF